MKNNSNTKSGSIKVRGFQCPSCKVILEDKGHYLEVFDYDVFDPEISEIGCIIESLNPRKDNDRRTLLVFSYTIGASLERWDIDQYTALKYLDESAKFAGFDDKTLVQARQQLISGVEGMPNRAWVLTDDSGDDDQVQL